jgi:hypothetical protein
MEIFDLNLKAIEQRIHTETHMMEKKKKKKKKINIQRPTCPRLQKRAQQKILNEQKYAHFNMQKMQTVPTESYCGIQFKKLVRSGKGYSLVWHGTHTAAVPSILSNGLKAGGSHGVPVRNGAAHGRGIYVGKKMYTSANYCRGAFLLCALFKPAKSKDCGSFLVVKSHTCLVPVMLGTTNRSADGSIDDSMLLPWLTLLGSIVDEGRGRLSELELIVDAKRMKIGGRYCYISKVLRAYGLNKATKRTSEEES